MLEIFRPLFEPHILLRGKDYFASGLVTIVDHNQRLAVFLVRGSSHYQVQLDFKNPEESTCSCPYFDAGMFCKHMWAALLKADTAGLFSQSKGKPLNRFSNLHQEKSTDVLPLPAKNSAPVKPLWQRLAEQAETRLTQTERFSLHGHLSHENPRQAYFVLNSSSAEMRLSLYYRETKVNGKLGSLKQAKFHEGDHPLYESPADQQIFKNLLADIRPVKMFSYSDYDAPFELILAGDTQRKTLELIAKLGKLFLIQGPRRSENLTPIVQIKENLKAGILVKKSVSHSDEFEVSTAFFLAESPKSYFDTSALTAKTFELTHDNAIHPVVQPLPEYWRHFFYGHHPLKLQEPELREFLIFLLTQDKTLPLPVRLPEGFDFSIQKVKPTGQIQLLWQKPATSLDATLGFSYEGTVVTHDIETRYIAGSQSYVIERDFEAEAELQKLFYETVPNELSYERLESFLKIAGPYFQVLLQNKPVRNVKEIDIQESSGIDWFKISGSISFDGDYILRLPEILKGLSQNKLLTLPDGSLAPLPAELYKELTTVARVGQITKDGITLTKIQALFLQQNSDGTSSHSLFSKGARKRFLLELKDLLQPEAKDAPKAFKGQLRNYQQTGLSWLYELAKRNCGGILADEMGLGKTIQILAYLAGRKKNEKHLLVVPKSLLGNWENEIQKFTPHLKFARIAGAQRGNILNDLNSYQIVLITYQTLLRDLPALKDTLFESLILDEAHYVKNSKTQSYQACSLIQAKQRFLMTGTPIENSLGDLVSLMSLANPGMFSQKFLHSQEIEPLRLFAGARPFLLRRTKAEVLKDLPSKIEEILYCEMSESQQRQYNELRDYYRTALKKTTREKGLARSKIVILEALLRLRQVAVNPRLLNQTTETESCKFETLNEMITELHREGHKALIFSQFTEALKLCAEDLRHQKVPYCYLDGSTKNRQELVDAFQNNSELCAFLISLKAGGVGLNLTAANYVFILDPWWNPAAEAQAMDRAHRIGQKNKVMVYKLITKNTVEEKILEMQKKKKQLAKDLFQSEEGLLKSMTEDDLDYLFS